MSSGTPPKRGWDWLKDPMHLLVTVLLVEKLGSRLCERVLSGPGQVSAALANALGGVRHGRGAGGEDFFNKLNHYAKELCA